MQLIQFIHINNIVNSNYINYKAKKIIDKKLYQMEQVRQKLVEFEKQKPKRKKKKLIFLSFLNLHTCRICFQGISNQKEKKKEKELPKTLIGVQAHRSPWL